MTFPKWVFLLSVAVNSVRVAEEHASVDTRDAGASTLATPGNLGKVEGKVIKCTMGGRVVFEQAEQDSTFTASLEYVEEEDVGSTDWVVTIPGIVQIKVESGSMMVAHLGNWFVPESYNIYPNEKVDPTGKEMQDIFTSVDNWVQKVRIIRHSDTTIKVIVEMRRTKRGNGIVEIEFTGGPGPVENRVNLPALEYYMPMQGKIIRMTVDDRTVFDKAYSDAEFPVVCTPAFLNISNPARGLSVNFVGFINFSVRKTDMDQFGHFTPNFDGYSTQNNQEVIYQEMRAGFERWRYPTNLTIRSNKNTVEINGYGIKVVFSKEKVEGKVTKCIAPNGSVVFDKSEKDSAIMASWEYVHNPQYISGWAINIPSIFRIIMKDPTAMTFNTGNATSVNNFKTTFYTCDPSTSETPIDPTGQQMREIFCSEAIDWVSIIYVSHKTIKVDAHRINGGIVRVEFSRGSGAAMADDYVSV